MNNLLPVLQVLQITVALILLNVWTVRLSKSTAYRGGNAKNLKEEFAVYGLPVWFYKLIGALKLGSALALLAGLWFTGIVFPVAVLVCLLMIGAIAMHLKVRDSLIKFVPAFLMLVMSAIICQLSSTLYLV